MSDLKRIPAVACPPEVVALVEKFEQHLDAYKSGRYNETQLRREFVDPLFGALGWDIANQGGLAEAYKDVVHEDAIRIEQSVKAPDYSFRIGGTRKFFLETKKPSVFIKEEVPPAFQLRRYAWSAKLPLSILSDFEEFAVYDTRIKPDRNDKASTARIQYFTYKDYSEKWHEIARVFSKDAVLKGSFDKYAETSRLKKGTATVDDAFLGEIESWRDLLARNIALRNPKLSQRELNFCVQRTIDRIVFLRICEDRGIEEYGRLQMQLNGVNVYKRLVQLFSQADDRYNSGLFHFQREKDRHEEPDNLTPKIAIDDKPLKEIVNRLYYPESPYEFSVLSADILGQVYEQFLGKVIRLTAGHQAKVEEKPEVRKAGGVYYTPKYIVDYIVKNTVGKLLYPDDPPQSVIPAKAGIQAKTLDPRLHEDDKQKKTITPKEASKLRILDPACGSGSFLLGAYQYLLDWHRDWYVNDDPKKWSQGKNPVIYQAKGDDWHLTTAEKKRILLNNIYGVDIDSQAVEVTKLSLLLKVLEGENNQTLSRQYKMFHERALPDLGDNIKCGNSLIGPDFYENDLFAGAALRGRPEKGQPHGAAPTMNSEERLRINAFDWNAEFPEIFTPSPRAGEGRGEGGFDAVIGNPPYVRQEGLGDYKDYFSRSFAVYNGTADLYAYFIERGVSLLKDGGLFAYIVANKWLRANYGAPLRAWLKDRHIVEITDFGDLPVFKGATTYPCILVIRKAKPARQISVTEVKTLEFGDLQSYVDSNKYPVGVVGLDDNGWSLADEESQQLLEKVKAKGVPLGEYVKGKIYRGVLTGFNEAFVIDEEKKKRLIKQDRNSAEIIKPFLIGRDIKRYQESVSDRWVIFTRRGIKIDDYPAIELYLSVFKERLVPKPSGYTGKNWPGRKPGSYKWYEIQDSIDYYAEFEQPKILWPEIAGSARFTYDETGYYANNKVFIIPDGSKYLLGLLNSALLRFFIERNCTDLQGNSYNFSGIFVGRTPIRVIDIHSQGDKACHDKMASLVDQMLSLNKQLPAAKTDHEKTALQRQIDATDRQIDQLVYELYGLTEEEIGIVEAAAK